MNHRIAIYPKDIQVILNVSERTARNIYKKAKEVMGKDVHQALTFREFCEYEGIKFEELIEHYPVINNKSK